MFRVFRSKTKDIPVPEAQPSEEEDAEERNNVKDQGHGPWKRHWSRERRCHYWEHSMNDTVMWSEPNYTVENEPEEKAEPENDSDQDDEASRDESAVKKEKKWIKYNKDDPPSVEVLVFPIRFPPKSQLRLLRAHDVDALEVEPMALNASTTHSTSHSTRKQMLLTRPLWEKRYSSRHARLYWRNTADGSVTWEEPPLELTDAVLTKSLSSASIGDGSDAEDSSVAEPSEGDKDEEVSDSDRSSSSSASKSSSQKSESPAGSDEDEGESSESDGDEASKASSKSATESDEEDASQSASSKSGSDSASQSPSERSSNSDESASKSATESDSGSGSEKDSDSPSSSNNSTPEKPVKSKK